MPPPLLCEWWCRKNEGSPSALHSQSITLISNSVHAGLEACSKPAQEMYYWDIWALSRSYSGEKGFLSPLTQVNPTQLMASASMSPSIDGHEVRLG